MPPYPTPLSDTYSLLGLNPDGHLDRKAVSDYLQTQIKAAFSAGHRRVGHHCTHLKALVIHEHRANGASLDPYFEVLARIQDAMRTDTIEIDIVGDWAVAIQAAVDSREWNGDIHRINCELVFKAEIAKADAACRLKGIGLGTTPARAPSEFSDEQHDAIARSIGKRVMQMGGIEVAARLFNMLDPTFCAEQGRYHDVNRFGVATSAYVPRVPTNFLLQLAAKFPEGKKPYRRTDEDWKALLALSTDYATLHGVQPASNMQWWPKDALSVLPFMRELALHDSLYTMAQLRATDVVRIARGLVDALRGQQRIDTNTYAQVSRTICVIEGIQALIGDTRGPVQLTEAEIVSACADVSAQDVRSALKAILAHPPPGANTHFVRPTEIPDNSKPREERAGTDFADRPLLRLGNRTYVVLSHSAGAPAFIEAVLSQLRRVVDDKHVGEAIELFLREQLALNGITTKAGKYRAGEKILERHRHRNRRARHFCRDKEKVSYPGSAHRP